MVMQHTSKAAHPMLLEANSRRLQRNKLKSTKKATIVKSTTTMLTGHWCGVAATKERYVRGNVVTQQPERASQASEVSPNHSGYCWI